SACATRSHGRSRPRSPRRWGTASRRWAAWWCRRTATSNRGVRARVRCRVRKGAEAAPGMIRGCVFDMDGVLIDTEPVWRRVEREVFARVGVHLTEEQLRETWGLRIEDLVEHWY